MTYFSPYKLIRLEDGEALLMFLEKLLTQSDQREHIDSSEEHPVYGRSVREFRSFIDSGFGHCLVSVYSHAIEPAIIGKTEPQTETLIDEFCDA